MGMIPCWASAMTGQIKASAILVLVLFVVSNQTSHPFQGTRLLIVLHNSECIAGGPEQLWALVFTVLKLEVPLPQRQLAKRFALLHHLFHVLSVPLFLKLGYGLDDRGSVLGRGNDGNFFSPPSRPVRLWGPLSLLSNRYRGLCPPGVKRLRREADHSPPSGAEVKNAWNYTSAPPVRLHSVVLS